MNNIDGYKVIGKETQGVLALDSSNVLWKNIAPKLLTQTYAQAVFELENREVKGNVLEVQVIVKWYDEEQD